MSLDAEALITAMEGLLDMTVAPEHRPGVAAHLLAARGIAAALLAVELPEEGEPAPVFTP